VISLYRPGRSLLHRLPAGAKLIGLAVVILAVSLWPHTPITAGTALVGVFALYLLGAQWPPAFARQLWAAKWIVVLMVATQLLFGTWQSAITATSRVLAAVLLAALVTATTRTSDMLDALERALGPLRVFRVDPARVSFLLSLTIAAIPVIAGLFGQIAEAHRARGIRLSPRAIVSLLVLALRHADDMGDAITARGGS